MVQWDGVAFGAMYVHTQVVRHWLMVGTMAIGAVCAATLAGIALVVSRRPSAKQVEERRRRRLAATGRIVDGSLIAAEPAEETPQTLIYRYRIAGVTYECSQDISMLGNLVQNLRLEFPVQVRYSRENPADSIVVAETWNGLWTNLWHSSGPRLAPSGDRLAQLAAQAKLSTQSESLNPSRSPVR
jgi:hypothetical protein